MQFYISLIYNILFGILRFDIHLELIKILSTNIRFLDKNIEVSIQCIHIISLCLNFGLGRSPSFIHNGTSPFIGFLICGFF